MALVDSFPLCVGFQASMWPSIPLVVPQATLGTAMGLATSIQMVGIGLSNLIVGQILGTKSRYKNTSDSLLCAVYDINRTDFTLLSSSETKIPLWRWQRMMIFMLANTICCIVTSVFLNIVDYRQVRHLCAPLYEIRATELTAFHATFSAGRDSEQDNQEVGAGGRRLGAGAAQPEAGRGGAKSG